MSCEEIALKIKEKRNNAGLSQSGLASLIGVSEQTVYYWEAGKRKPSLDYILRMSYIFCCDVGDLIGGFRNEKRELH